MSSKKIEEGLDHIKLAEKCLKTSLLKWRPDYEEAADEYNKAATCFRNAKAFEQCKDCLLKAADCFRQNRNGFYAAKAIDQAILATKELGDYREIPSMALRAANYFQTSGNAESAASTLDKAAKILEQQYPAEALKLFHQAAETAIIQDSSRQAAEYTNKVARLHLRLREYDLAADAIRREMSLHQQDGNIPSMGRLAVGLVLVQLARGDVVAAEKAFKEWGNCCEGAEVQTLESLLAAYDEEDREAARRALNSPFIKHMDVEFSILARDMPLPEGILQPAQSSGIRENAAPSYVSQKTHTTATIEESGDQPPAVAQDEDEEEGGLC